MVNACLLNIATFACYSQVKELFASPNDNDSGKDDGGHLLGSLTAGLISGFASAYLSTPTDYIKIQAQLRGISSAAALRDIFLGGTNANLMQSTSILFRGHVANLGREGVFTMVYLGLYDFAMSNISSNQKGDEQASSLAKVAAISSITGGLAWIVSYPFDTVKTIMQGTQPSTSRVSIPEALRRIYHGGGYAAFYRGCGASTGRAVLVTSSRMITYEWVAKTLFDRD